MLFLLGSFCNNSSLNVLALADPHIDPDYLENHGTADFCRAKNPWQMEVSDGFSFPQGQYGCDLPVKAYNELAQQLLAQEKYDYILMPGDIVSHGPTPQAYNSSF